MKNKGFTLIELLAVIVILAIIALIATPIILGIINDAKEQANQRSAEMYLKAINNSIVSFAIENKKIADGTYNIVLNTGNICLKHDDSDNNKCIDELPVEIDGEVPSSGTIIVNNGTVTDGTILTIGNITYIKENGDLKKQLYKTYNDGDIVYFDIKEGKGCTKELYEKSLDETKKDYLNSSTGYNGYTNKDENNVDIEKLDNQNSCLKFYAFLDDGGEKLNLLLDHNTSIKIAWTNSEINTTENGPIDAIEQLYKDTKDWKGTITPSDYKYDYSESNRVYTIEYSKKPEYEGATTPYKARLIEANEIAKITGADKALNWNETSTSSAGFYLDGAKGTDLTWNTQVVGSSKEIKVSDYYWLFDRTAYNCTNYGCKINSSLTAMYWTSSAQASTTVYAFGVHYLGQMSKSAPILSTHHGIRPVIEVSKSKL